MCCPALGVCSLRLGEVFGALEGLVRLTATRAVRLTPRPGIARAGQRRLLWGLIIKRDLYTLRNNIEAHLQVIFPENNYRA